MRLSILVALVTLLGTACGGEDAPSPTGTGEAGAGATVTTTSGFAGPSDTTPPTLEGSFTVPLADGFGVVCAGSTEPPDGSFALLEGPFSDGAEADAVVAFYEQFLESEGVSIEHVDKGRNYARFEGRTTTGPEQLVFVETANTVHSRTVLIAVASSRAAFSLTADAMGADPACWGGEVLRAVAGAGETVTNEFEPEPTREDVPATGAVVALAEIYAAVARELAEVGQLDGVVYFGDRVGSVPELEPSEGTPLLSVGTPLSVEIKNRIEEAITDHPVEFGSDWQTLARSECEAHGPGHGYFYYELGAVRAHDTDTVEVLVALFDANAPTWERFTMVHAAGGWQLVEREPTGMYPAGDTCL